MNGRSAATTKETCMLRSIDVDWDIHRLIETERKGFDEPPYLALRRLLKLPPPTAEPEQPKATNGGSSTGVPWRDEGVEVPHGSLAHMDYLHGRQSYEGQFLNGRLVINGQSFQSLSAAANA